MPKVIHLIPYDGIGGVETAARSMDQGCQGDIDFTVDFIFRPGRRGVSHRDTFNPLPLLTSAYRILTGKVDVLIVSLWRAAVVGVLIKWLRPRIKLILFLHLPNDVHRLDRLFTRWAARLAFEVWADSRATLARRLPALAPEKGRVISFVTARIAAPERQPVRPVFIFWGRIHVQKGLERALRIFAEVRAETPSARFIVIGPDGGDLARVQTLTAERGIADAVQFCGPMDFTAITQVARAAAFYLQTSELEGMAMAVVEAMQLGLVPVVTPVGEIGNYCRHDENALIVADDAAAVAAIVALLRDDARYQSLRRNAVATWLDRPLYAESVLQACRDILRQDAR